MKPMATVLLAIVVPTAASWAAIPLQVNYEGRVTVAGTPFNGNSLFRFSLANRDTSVTLWCNDGSRLGQPANSTPTAAVTVPVVNGIVSVGLGNTALANMTSLPSTVFDSDRVVLRVWFDDGAHGNRLLSPDQPITSVAYAYRALRADAATTATYAAGAGSAVRSDRSDVSDLATTATYALRASTAAASMLSTQSISANYATTATVALSLAGGGGGGAGIPWTEVTAASIQAAANHGYVANSPTTVTVTLPTSATLAVGDVIAVSGAGTGGWKIAQNAGQKIRIRGYGVLDYSRPWTAQESNRNWSCVASSADGTKLVICVQNGQIYTSSDSGVTWAARESNRNWSGVASSVDGTKLVACVNPGQIHTSSDSGVTWTPRESSRNWYGVASSADGIKLIACAWNGQIYTSADSGATWTARDSNRGWNAVASAADGTKLVASVQNGPIYTSSNSGVTWTVRDTASTWIGVASSADGAKLIACAYAGPIHTSSDSGATWTTRAVSNLNWRSVASSADGTRLVAVAQNGQIYTSSDSGVTWTARESNRTWYGVASSADGRKLVACVYGGQIYTLDAWQRLMPSETTAGTSGSLTGAQYDAVELQYVGGNEFLAICHNAERGAGSSATYVFGTGTATTATVALTALNANHATTADTATTATVALSAVGTVPIGAVTAWLKSMPATPSLPPNFVECNGQTLSDPDSPYNGQVVPNLNGVSGGTQRFLRGSTSSGTTGGSDTNTHTHTGATGTGSTSWGGATGGVSFSQSDHYHDFTTGNPSNTNNLPSYYEIVWIMRIK